MVWILAGLVIVGAIVAIVATQSRDPGADLGAVSHQWIAEHRLGQKKD